MPITQEQAETIIKEAMPPWSFTNNALKTGVIRYPVEARDKSHISHDALVQSGLIVVAQHSHKFGEKTLKDHWHATNIIFDAPDSEDLMKKGELVGYFLDLHKLEAIAGKKIEDIVQVPGWGQNWRSRNESQTIGR